MSELEGDARARFAAGYRQELHALLDAGAGEGALFRAYDLGRRAIAARLSLVDLVAIHHAVVAEAADGRFPTDEDRRRFQAGQEYFLQQCLAPFEMVTRGYAEALARESAARQQAEAAVRARDEFLSIAAHELKTPMVSLRLAVQFLQQQLEQGARVDPAHLHRVLRTADLQIGKLSHLVVQLLEVSRLQLGAVALERATVNLVELVGEAVELAQARATRHDLRLSAPAEAWANVDAARLEQVITNLLDNAIKYSPDGGPIDVALVPAAPGLIRLTVRDRGMGIPPDRRPHLFELFYQAHAESHRSGMGIGLYVSRQIVELHGGRIALTFPADGGTAAIVDLPTNSAVLPIPAHPDGAR
jgi:signal transduction histidine kinase